MRKNRGFSLIETLCALVILAMVILAAFAVLDYTLKITVASRNRMAAFAVAERTAVATLASGKDVPNLQVDSNRKSIHDHIVVDGANRPIAVEVITHKEKTSARLDRLMKRPVFVIFLKK
jgi:prepilin-type N-terminal cleavage/methylation domain-containing protein